MAQRFDRCIHVTHTELSSADVADRGGLTAHVTRATEQLELPAKRRDRESGRAAPQVAMRLRSRERRLLEQGCGIADEFFGFAQRPLGLGHPVGHRTERRDHQQRIGDPVRIAELAIQRFGSTRGFAVFRAAGVFIEPGKGQAEACLDPGRQVRRRWP